jgi:hypothetical protein
MKNKKVKIEFDYEHLSVLITALEVYSRLRSGQVDMAMSEAYGDRYLDWNEREAIHRHVRYAMFPSLPERRYDGHGGFYDQYNNVYDESGSIVKESEEWIKKKNSPHLDHPNSSFGVGNTKEMRCGTIAWEIKKVIDQYLHYERNGGFRRICDVSGDGASKFSNIDPPKILDEIAGYWKPQKEFRIPQGKQESMKKALENKDYEKAWNIVHSSFCRNPLPTGTKTRIEEVSGTYYVIVEEPYMN